MSKARDLADFVSAGNPLADGTIDVAEVSGAAPLASPTFTGTVTVPGLTTSANVTFGDNNKAIFGAGSDLEIYHSGTTSYIRDVGDGDLQIVATDDVFIRGYATNNYMARFNENSYVQLYYNNDLKFSTTSTGVDVTGTVTSDGLTAAGELIAYSYNETYAAVTSTSNATTVNCETGNTFMHTLTENTTFTFSNPPASGTAYTMTIEIIQDASASGFTVTWPTSVDWPSATSPTLTATSSGVDVFVFTTRDGGTTWYGFTAGQALG